MPDPTAQAGTPSRVDSKSDGAMNGIVGSIHRLHRLVVSTPLPSRSDDVDEIPKHPASERDSKTQSS